MSCLDENLVLDLVEGRLSPERRAAVEAHLDGCEDCQELVASLAGAFEIPTGDADEATAWSGIRASLRERYRLDEPLGAGAMGLVHAGRDLVLDRKVAIKLIHPRLARDLRLVVRMEREARTVARLNHPNVVQVYDFVHQRDAGAFIVMELVEGEDLRRWLRATERPWPAIVEVFAAAGRGLAAAHRAEILHRDFKPDNVMVGVGGQVRVMDFGLARLELDEAEASESAVLERLELREPELHELGKLGVTKTGVLMGTPLYMAPEQHRGQRVDARTDQFSFCVALFEALCGVPPFPGEGYAELRERVLAGRREPIPAGLELPARLEAVLERGLAGAPERRFASMDELVAELEGALATTHAAAVAGGSTSRRALAWAAGLGAAAVLALAGGAWALVDHEPDAPPPCTGAEERVAELWSPVVADELAAAFAATELPYAAHTWARVEAELDGWTQAWAQMRTEACEATRVRGEQSVELMDLRMRCLDEREAELRELLEVFADPDPAVVEHAIAAADSLGSLASCADQQALTARMPPPGDPELAAAVGRLRARLSEARSRLRAGKPARAIELVDAVLGDDAAEAYPPVRAEALLLRGKARIERGELDGAETDCEAAMNQALAAGHDEVLAHALIMLARILGHDKGAPEAGLELAERARAAVARLDDPPELLASWHQTRGLIATVAGEWEAALEHQRACLALLDEAPGEQLELRAATLNAIGDNLRRAGRPAEALELFEQALALRRTSFGPAHPDVADDLNNLAIALGDLGRSDETLPLYSEALAVLERAYGREHPDVGRLYNNLGMVAQAMGRHEEAVGYLEQALAIKQGIYGEDHPALGSTLGNLSNALRSLGRFEEAEAALIRARGLFAAKLGEDHWAVAQTDALLGRLHVATGELDEARRLAAAGLRVTEAAVEPGHPLLGARLVDLGLVELARDEPAEALAHYRRALAIYELQPSPNPGDLGSALLGVGRAQVELGETAPAIEPLTRALELLERGEELDELGLAEARFGLARALWREPGRRDEARELLRLAAPGFEAPAMPPVRRRAFAAWKARR